MIWHCQMRYRRQPHSCISMERCCCCDATARMAYLWAHCLLYPLTHAQRSLRASLPKRFSNRSSAGP
ncbi:hypothetical protein BKA81DRAFT_344977 [Phyllosticta paracitricarpa]